MLLTAPNDVNLAKEVSSLDIDIWHVHVLGQHESCFTLDKKVDMKDVVFLIVDVLIDLPGSRLEKRA